MSICWYQLLYLISSTLIYVSSASLDSIYLDFIQRNISDYTSLNNFYRTILQDLRQHRLIDTVASPINLSKIRSHQYDEEYIKTSVKIIVKSIFAFDILPPVVLWNSVRSTCCSWLRQIRCKFIHFWSSITTSSHIVHYWKSRMFTKITSNFTLFLIFR